MLEKIAMPFFLIALLVGCAGATPDAAPVTFRLENTGTTPISCRLIYGHWVERDYGVLPPGTAQRDSFLQQDSDGGLFTMRPDGQARMMIETVQCAQFPDWLGTVGQVDFTPARRSRVTELTARCAMPPEGGRIVCEPLEKTLVRR